jgi:hypothetical protein
MLLVDVMVRDQEQYVQRQEELETKRLRRKNKRTAAVELARKAEAQQPATSENTATGFDGADNAATCETGTGDPGLDKRVRLVVITTDGCVYQNRNKTNSASVIEWLNNTGHSVNNYKLYHLSE